MKQQLFYVALILLGGFCGATRADDATTIPAPETGEPEVAKVAPVTIEQAVGAPDEPRPFAEVVPDATRVGGPITTYTKKEDLFWELTPAQMDVDFIVIISIARGIGESALYGGQSWDFGDDMIWRFRKSNDRIQIVRRNYRYRANSGPDAEALKVAFTDSVIFSLPIVARGPQGGDVVDVTGLFLSDQLPMIGSRALSGFSFARDRSTWEKVKALKDNLELEVAATYSGRAGSSETVIDTRGVSVNVHYSISRLPETGYQPRYADERVGYFNTAIRDVSKISSDDNFVRYINRWNLQKLEPNAEVSLPKKPIVFWLDRAVPYQYRKTLRDGVLEWNRAFEKAGFYNAVEVRQQEDNDDWDPEDINYNTIRWSATQTGFSIGPSRVNPTTGEILDADVVLSVGFLSGWARQFELFNSDKLAEQFSVESARDAFLAQVSDSDFNARKGIGEENRELFYSQQFGLANTFFEIMAVADEEGCDEAKPEEAKADEAKPEEAKADEAKSEEAKSEEAKSEEAKAEEAKSEEAKADEAKSEEKTEEQKKAEEAQKAEEEKKAEEARKAEEEKQKAEAAKRREERKAKLAEEQKKMVEQGLRQLSTHEVGHTLGLRHNFRQSSLHTLDEINDPSRWTEYGYVGSVMEYSPVNIMPKGRAQGDYYSYRLGAYDEWVIDYGYRVFQGKSTDSELPELKKIASMQTRPELNYSTDEDCYGSTSDPYVNIWDLGSNPLEYAKARAELVKQLLPGLNDAIVEDGESYRRLQTRFNMLASWKGGAMNFAAKYIGGIRINRDFKGDDNGRAPFVVVPAKDQRDAMAFLNEEVFGIDSYEIPSQLFNYLAPNRWNHWGSEVPDRYDVDIHSTILSWQNSILSTLLSSMTLSHLADSEMRVAPGEDVFTSAEMIDSLTDAVFKEIALSAAELNKREEGKTPSPLTIKSTRRNLQRVYLERLAEFATQRVSAAGVADFGALSRMQMRKVRANVDAILNGGVQVDSYSRAHLEDIRERITRTLEAVQTLGSNSSAAGAIVLSL